MKTSRNRLDYMREYRRLNREKINEYSREYAKNNRDKRRVYEYSWRERHPDKVKIHNAKGGAKWAKLNKGLKNFASARRRAAIRQRTPIWADMDVIRMFYLLAQRISEVTGIPHEVDHIYPLQGVFVSGLHVPDNLRIIPRSLNRSKKNEVFDSL